jgi:cysteine desulfurase
VFAPICLDHNATTPLDGRVLGAMLPFLTERYGNPSSRHEYGRAARLAVDTARQQVAAAVGAHPTEVVFTSGGSEANNLFIKGAAARLKPGVVAVSAIEHPCVREPARDLERLGWKIREIAVDAEGRVAPAAFAAALAENPALISVMLANNETGVLQDIPALAAQAQTQLRGQACFHTDAVQALGKVAIDFRALAAAGVNALTVSAHKIYGPKGAAALVLDKRVELAPLISGGGQERALRSGTENVAAIAGFGVACELAAARLAEDAARLLALRETLEDGIAALGATIFSRNAPRLPNTTFFTLAGIDGETLVAQLDRAGFAVASGSACSSVSPEPSRTLLAMGVEADIARGALRVSPGRANTREDITRFLQGLADTVRKLKGLAAVAA